MKSGQDGGPAQPVEVTADRTQYSDTYLAAGGDYETKVSTVPINYAINAQSWAPIDDTLTTDTTAGFAAENTANSYKAEFPATLASPIRVGTSTAWVTSSLVGAGGTLQETGNTATYANALPGVTVTYAADADQVKESVVLASAAAPSSFVYHLAVSAGAKLKQDGSNVDLVEGDTTVSTIPALTVADVSGAAGTVTSLLAADPDGGWDLTVTVASDWLNDPSRSFPVTVDPSFDFSPANFCEIDSYTPTTSNCTSTGSLSVGTVSHSSTLYKQRDLVNFTLGSNVPYDAQVTNADLFAVDSGYSSENIVAKPVSQAWNTNASWSDAESGVLWGTAGGSTIPSGYGASGYTASDPYLNYEWYVTGIVQNWLTSHSYPNNAGVTNNGLLLESTNETVNQNTSIGDVQLDVFWQYRMGDQAGVSYGNKVTVDDQASLAVDAANGDGKLTTNDLNIPGVGNNLSVSHTYNSWAAADGSGWSFTAGQDVQALVSSDSSIIFKDGTGRAQMFTGEPTAQPAPCVVNGVSYTTGAAPPLDTNDCAHGVNELTSTGIIYLVDNNTQTSYTFGGTANASNGTGTIADGADYAYYLTAITDRNGNSITFSYNSSNQLISMTDTEGRTFTVTPNTNNGEPATIAGPTGATGSNYRTWTYNWSSSTPSQLNSYEDPTGAVTSYYYDANGNLDKIVAPGTSAGTTETDLNIGPLGETRGVTTDDTTCPSGACTTTYDTARVAQPTTSNPLCTSYAGSGETISQPTIMVGCATVTDPRGKVTSYGYTVFDSVVKTVDPNHNVTLGTYTTAHNQPATSTDALGNISTATYDMTSQNLATSTDPITSTGQTAAMSVLAYKTSPTAVNGGAYLPSSATDPSNDCTYYGYDTNGNRTDTWTGLPSTTPGATAYCPSPTTPPTGAAHTIDAYQGDSGIPSCHGHTGQLCSQTNPNGNTTTYSYTSGELMTVTPPSPHLGATTYTYDANGRQLTVTDGAGRTTAYTYDADDRVLTTNHNPSGDPTCANATTCITYTYDPNGNRISMLDNTGTTTWSYNQRNAMTAEYLPGAASRTCGELPTGPDNIVQVTDTGIHYGYDADGNLTGYCDAGGTVSYAYDADNNLIGVADPGGNCTPGSIVQPCTQYGYNTANQKTSITYPTAMAATETLTPDGASHVKQFTVTEAGNTVLARTYSYADPTTATTDRGRLLSVDDTVAHVTTTYSYDTYTPYLQCADQTNDPGHTTPGLTLLTYGYDLDGNITSTISGRSSCTATTGGTTVNYTYNNADQSTTGTAAFDNAGNQTETQSGTTLTYNALTQTTAIGSDSLAYTGGGQGGLNTDSSTGLQNSAILGVTAATTSGTIVYFTRDPNGNLVTMRVGSSNYSYVLDPYKNVIALLAASGTSPAATYTYTPYGKQLTTLTGVGATNPFQYNSGYQTASGDIHFGARYYDPNIGRWTQLDPSGKDASYVFADDNPTNEADPTGRENACFAMDDCAKSQGGTSIPYESILNTSECVLGDLRPGEDDSELVTDGLGTIGTGVGITAAGAATSEFGGFVAIPAGIGTTIAGGYITYQGVSNIASSC